MIDDQLKFGDKCPYCGSDFWSHEMGGSTHLWHLRSCSEWHWYFDGGPSDWVRPFDYPHNSCDERDAGRGAVNGSRRRSLARI